MEIVLLHQLKRMISILGKCDLTFNRKSIGNSKMIVDIKRNGGKLIGNLIDPEGKNQPTPMTDIQDKPDGIDFGFTAKGFNVTVQLFKVDQNHLKGKMIDKFVATTIRKK